jgi:RNA polymerase II subunit A small phosphatase-like protein
MTQLDRKLLVLDLDETLVHATDQPLARAEDFKAGPYHVYRRPHLSEFIAFALARFHVGVWTSSGEQYAARVVESVFPAGALQFVWASQRCTVARDWQTGEYCTLKKLGKLKRKGYRLDSIIAVDDTPSKYERSFGNLVAVQEYLGAEQDDELLLLMRYLDRLSKIANVRTVEKRRWRTETGVTHAALPADASREEPIKD